MKCLNIGNFALGRRKNKIYIAVGSRGVSRVGWYTEPVVLMYAADGRTRYTLKSEVDAYKKVGWYTEPYTPPKTNSSSSGSSSGSSSSSGVVRGSTVYVTPSGKKYHYSASCAGKNARATTLSAAQASSKCPCSKCAR